jgi:hypothetical protein
MYLNWLLCSFIADEKPVEEHSTIIDFLDIIHGPIFKRRFGD